MVSIGVCVCVSLLQLLIFVKLSRNSMACHWRTSHCYIFTLFPQYILIFHWFSAEVDSVFVCWHHMVWVMLWMFWRKMVPLHQPWRWRWHACWNSGNTAHFNTSTWCRHLKTDLTLLPVRKLTWQPYRLWYTRSVKLSCENNVWRLPKNDWIWLEIRYLYDTSLILCQVEEWQ